MIRRDGGRPLTPGEQALVRSVFGDAIGLDRVRIHRRRWWPLHPRDTCMAPDGHLWLHPGGALWHEDFSVEPVGLQGFFVHEMTHVWQAQQCGRWYLPLMRHPFCRYRYTLHDGWPLARYGLEQQAEIVRHGWLIARGIMPPGAGEPARYPALLSDLRARS